MSSIYRIAEFVNIQLKIKIAINLDALDINTDNDISSIKNQIIQELGIPYTQDIIEPYVVELEFIGPSYSKSVIK